MIQYYLKTELSKIFEISKIRAEKWHLGINEIHNNEKRFEGINVK